MKSIETLTHLISKLPGIGPRQARRIVFYLLSEDDTFLSSLSDEIGGLKKHIKRCKESFAYFYSEDSNEELHPIARDSSRENALMVIEKDTDLESIEKSGLYHGKYFVLGGNLPVVSKEPEKTVRIVELKSYIERNKPSEIILALNANPEGDNTASYLQNELNSFGIKISILGRGFSTGTEIEYSDKETLNSALMNRS